MHKELFLGAPYHLPPSLLPLPILPHPDNFSSSLVTPLGSNFLQEANLDHFCHFPAALPAM